MITIELYRIFLKNSIKGLDGNESRRVLLAEREKIKAIFSSIENSFDGDIGFLNNNDRSIYSLIKTEAFCMFDNNIGNYESTYVKIKYYIYGLLSEIDSLISNELISA